MSVDSVRVQSEALRYIWQFISDKGYPPTVREIGAAVGYRSPSSAQHIVEGMARRGWIASAPGKSRTMRITQEGIEVLA